MKYGLTDEELRTLYPKIRCSDVLWRQFADRMNDLGAQYRATIPDGVLPESPSDELRLITTGMSIKRTPILGLTGAKYRRLVAEYSLPPVPREIAESLRTIPGSMLSRSRRFSGMVNDDIRKQICAEYHAGASFAQLRKKYRTSDATLKEIVGENRTALRVRAAAGRVWLRNYGDDRIRSIYEENPGWSLEDLVMFLIREGDGKVPRKTALAYVRSLGLEITPERQRAARKRKSCTEANTSWAKRQEGLNLIARSHFGSAGELTRQYCENKLGSYSVVARSLNEELGTDHFTARWIERVITQNPNYVKARSRSEKVFIAMATEALGLTRADVKTEFRAIPGSQARIDMYVPSLEHRLRIQR